MSQNLESRISDQNTDLEGPLYVTPYFRTQFNLANLALPVACLLWDLGSTSLREFFTQESSSLEGWAYGSRGRPKHDFRREMLWCFLDYIPNSVGHVFSFSFVLVHPSCLKEISERAIMQEALQNLVCMSEHRMSQTTMYP